MAEKKSGFKKLFSKPDCCSIEIEEVKSTENKGCCESAKENNEKQQKEA